MCLESERNTLMRIADMVGFNRVGCDHDSSLLQSDIKETANLADTFNTTLVSFSDQLV
jgi:hypothetical protein